MNKKYRQGILAAVLLLAWGSYSAGSKKALQELDVFQLNQFVFFICVTGLCRYMSWKKGKGAEENADQDR